MPVATLFDSGLEKFLDENGNRTGDLWLFVHIPKTAGSTFRNEMAKRLKPNASINVNYLDTSIPYKQQLENAIQVFLAADKVTPHRFVSGHITTAQALQIANQRPQTKMLTFLRHPVDRVISDYRYQLTADHPLHEKFARNFPGIENYVEDPSSQNKMFKRLAPRRPITNAEITDFLEKHFAFVGLLEGYPKSLNLVGRLIGERVKAEEHVRKTVDTSANKLEITDELRQRIAELNKRDMALYNHFRRRMAAIKLPPKEAPVAVAAE